MGIKVINPGPFSTIQDGGRKNYESFGVTPCGVMDSYSYRVANYLLENEEDSAVIECTLMGPELEFQSDTLIAITGADFSPKLNGKPVKMWSAISVRSGDTLNFGVSKSGCRSYIGVKGGIRVPLVMGSRSTDVRSGIGGIKGRPLSKGDVIPIEKCFDNRSFSVSLSEKFIPEYKDDIELRVILGPQDDYFTEAGIRSFLDSKYRVTSDSNRMGCRLYGEKIEFLSSGDIVSDAVSLGSIQVSSSGQPMILMADRQTTGGYSKIATVISTDIYKLAQVKPGCRIRFNLIELSDAHFLYRKREADFLKIKRVLEKQRREYSINLKNYRIRVSGRNYEVVLEEIY